MKKKSINNLGKLNQYWGICGFSSCFYAMHMIGGKRTKEELDNAKNPTRVLAEIKTYLMMLKIDEETQLLQDIQEFTRSFGKEYKDFTIDNYIKFINTILVKTPDEIIKSNYSIAMPPHAVVDYLQRVFERKAKLKKGPFKRTPSKGIVGVRIDKNTMYDGLCHYMYINKRTVYSWGKKFKSIDEAAIKGITWEVCCHISVS